MWSQLRPPAPVRSRFRGSSRPLARTPRCRHAESCRESQKPRKSAAETGDAGAPAGRPRMDHDAEGSGRHVCGASYTEVTRMGAPRAFQRSSTPKVRFRNDPERPPKRSGKAMFASNSIQKLCLSYLAQGFRRRRLQALSCPPRQALLALPCDASRQSFQPLGACMDCVMEYCVDCWGCFVYCGFGKVDLVGGLRNGVKACGGI